MHWRNLGQSRAISLSRGPGAKFQAEGRRIRAAQGRLRIRHQFPSEAIQSDRRAEILKDKKWLIR